MKTTNFCLFCLSLCLFWWDAAQLSLAAETPEAWLWAVLLALSGGMAWLCIADSLPEGGAE